MFSLELEASSANAREVAQQSHVAQDNLCDMVRTRAGLGDPPSFVIEEEGVTTW
jgi:hypothetical protein